MLKRYVNGTAFVYEAAGPAEPADSADPTIVLLHGFPLDARVWADVAARLAGRYRVVRPNLRGFGSYTSGDDFTIESLARDMYELLGETGDLPCVLCGLSMGGYVSMAFAKNWLPSLRGLCLVDTRSGADDDAGRAKREAMIERVRGKGGVPAVVAEMFPDMIHPETPRRDPAAAEVLMRVMLDAPAPTVERACRAMAGRLDYTPLLGDFAVPASVIVGAGDAITPPDKSRAMADLLPDATFETIDGAGHMSPIERPDLVADAIERLMARVRAGAGGAGGAAPN